MENIRNFNATTEEIIANGGKYTEQMSKKDKEELKATQKEREEVSKKDNSGFKL